MDRRRKTRDEETTLGMREYLVKLAPDRALTRRVSLAFDIGRILKQREHALLAVLRERVQVKHLVVGGSGVDLEIAGVNQYSERGVDGQRYAIDKTMRNVNRMDGEGPYLEPLSRPHLTQICILEQSVFFQ